MNRDTFEVQSEQEGERLDKYLSSIYPDISRSFFQRILKENQILVNDKPQKANYRLKTDDIVDVTIPDAVQTPILPQDIPLDILYEDDDVLVVNKPKGMVVHPSAGHLIVCKNDESHIKISEQIKDHSCNRIYVGIVCGNVKDDEGTIEGAIGRNPNDRKKMAINEKNGKPAVTHYKVLERFGDYTYMQFKLETGRTHQIRVHMASINHPLLGDMLYSSYSPTKNRFKGLEGQCLHAKTIGFVHPKTGEYMEFDAPLPKYFANLLEVLYNINNK
ncbi:MAG: RluA family pseudouridine synthase [[Eubacterium] rectale]|nr:RluA family pseudouridine synthase [Agathobacter rectalis]